MLPFTNTRIMGRLRSSSREDFLINVLGMRRLNRDEYFSTYEQGEKVGDEASMHLVLHARRLKDDQKFAVKLFRVAEEDELDDDVFVSLVREVASLRALSASPYVVRMVDTVFDHRLFSRVFLDLAVCDLKHHIIASHGPLPIQTVQKFMEDVLRAVNACHAAGIAHRDVKPSNFLIFQDGHLKITDFGLACGGIDDDVPVLRRESYIGTLHYMPPETLLGSTWYYKKGDVWSAGCVLMEMVHGTVTFQGKTAMDQALIIFKTLGSPNVHEWCDVVDLPCWSSSLPRWEPNEELFMDINDETFQALLRRMMRITPKERASSESLLDEYVRSVVHRQP